MLREEDVQKAKNLTRMLNQSDTKTSSKKVKPVDVSR